MGWVADAVTVFWDGVALHWIPVADFLLCLGCRLGITRGLQATGNIETFWVRGGRKSLGSSWENGRRCSSESLGNQNPSLSPRFGFSASTGGNGNKR